MFPRLLALCAIAVVPHWFLMAEPDAKLAAPAAHRVTLPKEELSLGEALAAITQQTGIVVSDKSADKDVSLKIVKADRTFWETLDAIGDSADLQPYGFNGKGILSLVPRRPGFKPLISHAGAFRVSLQRVMSVDDFENGGHSSAARLQLLWEPTLRPFYLNERPAKVMATGDRDKKAITLDAGGVVSLSPMEGRIGHVFDVPIPVVDRANSKLATLSGTLKATVAGKMLTFQFPTLDRLQMAPTTRTTDNITCAVDKVELRDDWRVTIRFSAPAGERFESSLTWIGYNEMVLVSVDGKRRLTTNRYSIARMGSEAIIVYTFVGTPTAPLGKPTDWLLNYTTPASIVEMTIPFEFKEVSLP